jgi:hypothetical protein
MEYAISILAILQSVLRALLSLPLWWYTEGLFKKASTTAREIEASGRLLHLQILFKNLPKPLYGYSDWETRFVSLIVRPGHFLVHLTIALAHLLIILTPFLLWLLLPPFIVYSIGYQLGFWSLDLYTPLWNALSFILNPSGDR